MKCHIGNGLKEILQVIFAVTVFMLSMYGLMYVLGYMQLWFWDGIVVEATDPTAYYLNAGGTILAIVLASLFFSFVIYWTAILIYTIFTNPRAVINWFINCKETE